MFVRIINTLKQEYFIKATITDADPIEFAQFKQKIEKSNCYIAFTTNFERIDDDLTDSYIYIFSRYGESNKDALENIAKEIFDILKVMMLSLIHI